MADDDISRPLRGNTISRPLRGALENALAWGVGWSALWGVADPGGQT